MRTILIKRRLRIRHALWLSLLLAWPLTAAIAPAAMLPTGGPTGRIVLAQIGADKAFRERRFDAARALYRNPLANSGDKHAQYLLGLIHLNGHGVPRNAALASAWLTLAAERGDRELEAARQSAVRQLGDAESRAMREYLGELRPVYGDCAVVARSLHDSRRRYRALRSARGPNGGSRVAQTVSTPVRVIYSKRSRSPDVQQLRRDIQKRRAYLKTECS